MAKWIAAEKAKAGLRHVVVCPNVTGSTKKMIAQSKRSRAGSLVIIVDWPQLARTRILRALLFADAMLTFSSVSLFFFLLFLLNHPRPFVQLLFDDSACTPTAAHR